MGIKALAGSNIAAVLLGGVSIAAVYLGSDLLYGTDGEIPETLYQELGTAAGAHRYWRVYGFRAVSGAFTGVTEIEMRSTPGGADECTGGTAMSSGSIQAGTAANCFDNNTTTLIQWSGALTAQWVGYDFGRNKKEIVEFAILPNKDDANRTFSDMLFQWSDDAITWHTSWSAANLTWTIGTNVVFSRPAAGASRYWRLRPYTLHSATTMSAAEIEFREMVGGADSTSGGAAFSRSAFTGLPASQAFDNNTATLWSGDSDVDGNSTVGYDYGSGVAKTIEEVAYTSRDSSTFWNQSMKTGVIESSTDGKNFLPRWEMSFAFTGQLQTLTAARPEVLPLPTTDTFTPHRAYRILFFHRQAADVDVGWVKFFDTYDPHFLDSGYSPSLTTTAGGAAIAGSTSGGSAAGVFNYANSYSNYNWYTTAAVAPGGNTAWIGWDFGAGNEQIVKSFGISFYDNYRSNQFKIQYCDDAGTLTSASNWQDYGDYPYYGALTQNGLPLPNHLTGPGSNWNYGYLCAVANIAKGSPNTGTGHRFWRFNAKGTGVGSSDIGFKGVRFVVGAHMLSWGTYWRPSSDDNGTFGWRNAWGASSSAGGFSLQQGNTVDQWIAIDAGKKVELSAVILTHYSSSYYRDTYNIEYSDDGVTWTVQTSLTGQVGKNDQAVTLIETGLNPTSASTLPTGFAVNNSVGSITFSDSNRRGTMPTSGSVFGCGIVRGRAYGKFYFEGVYGATYLDANYSGFGLTIYGNNPAGNGVGHNANTIGIRGGGAIYYNNVQQATFAESIVGDRVRVAVDITNRLVWFKLRDDTNWNNNPLADPSTGVGGFTVPFGALISPCAPAYTNSYFDIFTKAAEQTYAPPTGFSAWAG